MLDMPGTSAHTLEAGWTELRAGRWSPARAFFEQAVVSDETPEALEGLSWAAWWLDDSDAVFDARERAYRLYKARGDRGSAARMATWLAADQLDFRGAAAVANGWLRRAHRLLDSLEPGADHGWLAFHEGYVAYISGDADTASELGVRAAELGQRFEVTDLEMLGLALHGSTLVSKAQVAEGMRCLDEATAAALEGDATIPISSAWACCFLVSACTAVLDYDRASEWCDRIADFADRYGSRYMLAFCRAEYGAVHLWRGSWSDAEALLVASIEDYSGSRPAWVGSPLVVLADLRRRQGKSDEAALLLDQAGDGPECTALPSRPGARRWRLAPRRRASRAAAAPAARAPEARPRSGTRAAHPRADRAGRARRGGGEPRGIPRDRAPGRHCAASRLRRARGGHARRGAGRARTGSATAGGRGRSFRAKRCAFRGGSDESRARHEPRGVGPHRCSRARGVGCRGSTPRPRRGRRRPSGRVVSSPRPVASTTHCSPALHAAS